MSSLQGYLLMTLSALCLGCSSAEESQKLSDNYTVLGASESQTVWVYLCGLTDHFYTEGEVQNRTILDQVGIKNNLQILAIHPQARKKDRGNQLHWPHHRSEEEQKTWHYIQDAVAGKNISGYIGFSNGGFFLHQIAESERINAPIITVGASGVITAATVPNNIYLMIGKEDEHHYRGALKFYEQAEDTPLNVTLLEHTGGHIMPKNLIEMMLPSLSTQ